MSRPASDLDGTAGGLRDVTIATLIAAASGYLVLLLAARHLGPAGYGVFAVFWAAYGIVTGAQNGQLQETTRAVRAALHAPAPAAPARPIRVNAALGLGLAGLVAVTAPLWSSALFDADVIMSVCLLAAGVASFAVYAHLCGVLSGTVSWRVFGVLLTVDAMVRLAAAVVSVAAGWSVQAFLIVTVIGSISWPILLICSARARAVVALPADVATPVFTANTLTAMAAALASAVLVMGFPVLIQISTSSADNAAVIGTVILAITLTRAPLLVPLNSFQGVLITRFVDHRHRPAAALRGPMAAVALVGIVGSGAAWAVGPWLLTTVFGGDYRLSGVTLAWFTLGATMLALLTVSGAAAVAVGAHRWFAAGWWAATAVSIALLYLPLGVEGRVATALLAGPVVGVAVHLVGTLNR